MRIVKAVFVGCNRFALRNIWRFTYTPEMNLQIIIGTNGSGKSSLIELLTPLPAASASFSKGGSLDIEIEHRGEFYRIVNDFKSQARYYFWHRQDDGTEINMNDGGTATAQRELVRQVFNLTPEIQALISGKLKFTEMTTSQRKHWITLFNPADLSFALKFYNDLRVANRDTTGALKHIQNRIAVETSKLMDMEDVSNLEIKAKQLRDELNLLLLNKEQGVPKGWDTEAQLNAVMRNIAKCSTAIIELPLKAPPSAYLPTPHTMGDVDTAVSDLQQQLNVSESMLTHYVDEYMNLEGLLKTLESSGAVGIEELSVRLEQLEISEAKHEGSIQRFRVPVNTDSVSNTSAIIFDTLVHLFSTMPDNTDRRYNQDIYGERSRRGDVLKYDIDRRLNRISQLEDRLSHLEHTEDTKCPQCEHAFKPGLRPNEDVMIKRSLEELRNENIAANTELLDIQQYLEGANEYMTAIRRYKNITNQYPILSPLWNEFAEGNRFCLAPKECLSLLYVWQTDLQQCVILENIVSERKSLSEALDHASRMNNTGSGHFTERGHKLNEQINETTDTIGKLKLQLNQLQAYRQSLLKLSELKAEVVRDITKMEEIRDLMLRITRDELLSNCIETHQTTLAMTQHVLNQKSTLEGIVKDLEDSASSLLVDKEALSLLDSLLSPTEGLIAEQLHGTIQDIVRQLNTVISAIWAYDLLVLPCSSAEGELDYKFPRQVNEHVVPDVIEGSEGQRGIVDLAFRLLAYTHLGLEEFPLYLDETGREFDDEHKLRVMNYVKECVSAHQFSQAFIISHYAATYGSFLHADIVVMDPANVVVPDKHNTCVEIEYGN